MSVKEMVVASTTIEWAGEYRVRAARSMQAGCLRSHLSPAKAGSMELIINVIRWWRPDESGLTTGYYL